MARPPAKQRTDYDAMREAAASRNRDAALSGRDIGEIPPVSDPVRKARARLDAEFFLLTYFPLTFCLALSADHRTAIRKAMTAILEGGLFALAMPRGSGKTTIAECLCIWAALYGHRKFILLIGASESKALELLDSIKTELDGNELLLADFPEACHAIAALDGIANRCKGQLHAGKRTHIEWQKKVIVLPCIDGSAASGVIIKVAGITGAVRGSKFKRHDGVSVRPDLVIPDDPQTDSSARSKNQCTKRENILAGAVLGLAGPGKKIAGIMPCTVIRTGDVADNILDRAKHPEWNGERTKMVYKFPTNETLWTQYADVRGDSLRAERGLTDATAFYIANRTAMDEGAVVGWPERFNHDEASALQHAMNLRLQDEAAFFAEYQNEPLAEKNADTDVLTAEQIARKLNGMARLIVPIGAQHLTAFIDVQGKLLYYMVVAWASDFTGNIVDYGSFPDQHRPYFTLRDAQHTLKAETAGAGQEGAIYAGLQLLTGALFKSVFKRDDGADMKIERCMIDANWGTCTDVVYQFCRESPHAALLLPSHGRYVGAGGKPFSDYTKKTGDRVGHNWRIPNVQGKRAIRHALFDTNYWKTFVHARLAVPLGDKGCLSLWGRDSGLHRLLAEHLTAEFRTKTEGRGRTVDEWKLRPEQFDNHWFDCLVGCAVAASMQGAALPSSQSPAKPRGKRINLAELQARNR